MTAFAVAGAPCDDLGRVGAFLFCTTLTHFTGFFGRLLVFTMFSFGLAENRSLISRFDKVVIYYS